MLRSSMSNTVSPSLLLLLLLNRLCAALHHRVSFSMMLQGFEITQPSWPYMCLLDTQLHDKAIVSPAQRRNVRMVLMINHLPAKHKKRDEHEDQIPVLCPVQTPDDGPRGRPADQICRNEIARANQTLPFIKYIRHRGSSPGAEFPASAPFRLAPASLNDASSAVISLLC